MSEIDYPHRVEVWRVSEADPVVQDEWGRDVLGPPVVVATVGCWIQSLSQQEQARLTDAGAVRSDHLIFMDPPAAGLSEGDALRTLSGGGQTDGVVHQINGIDDPDGTGHHFEISTVVVRSIEDILLAPDVSP